MGLGMLGDGDALMCMGEVRSPWFLYDTQVDDREVRR